MTSPTQTHRQPRGVSARWLAFLAVALVACFFRFYRLADHPLGTFFDPAINGLDAMRLVQRGGYAIFFPTNGGREAPFIYLLIPFIRAFGTTPFSLRLPTAMLGLLNVVLLFGFLYDLPALSPRVTRFSDRLAAHRLWIAALGGLALGASYWHLVISRLGQRPLLVPLLSVPIFWFFLKGWSSGRKKWFVLSGLLLGLEGYTYSASRLLPVVLALALAPDLLARLRRRPAAELHPPTREVLVNLALFTLVAALVYLPMAGYLLAHPAQFSARALSVMVWNYIDTPAAVAAELGRNTLRVLGFFCCVGNVSPIFGWPGQPGWSPLLAPFLLAGLIGAVANGRWLFHRLLAVWWLVGLAPSILAIEAPHPLRMIVTVVPTAILIALGPVYVAGFKMGAGPARFARRWGFPLLLAGLLLAMPGTFRAYFVNWTGLPATRETYDYEAVALRDEILARTAAAPETPLYLPFSRFGDSTLLYYLSGSLQRQAAFSAPPAAEAWLIAPPEPQPESTWIRIQGQTATLLPPLTAEGQEFLQAAWAGAEYAGDLRLAQLPADPARFVQQPAQAVDAAFGPARLVGANYPAVLDAAPEAQATPVTLFWEAAAPMNDEYEILLRLVDDGQRSWGQGDARPAGWVYPTTFWRPGLDRIAVEHRLALDSGPPPPGRYWLAVSVFDPATGRRLPLTAGASPAPDTFFLGPLKAPLPPQPLPAAGLTPQTAAFGEVARLAGFRLDPPGAPAGQPLRLTLVWEALGAAPADYTVFVHLLDSDDNRLLGSDAQPLGGRYPTGIWTAGERLVDEHTLPTVTEQGEAVPPGRYRLAIGLYDPASGERLPVYLPDGSEDPHQRLLLDATLVIE